MIFLFYLFLFIFAKQQTVILLGDSYSSLENRNIEECQTHFINAGVANSLAKEWALSENSETSITSRLDHIDSTKLEVTHILLSLGLHDFIQSNCQQDSLIENIITVIELISEKVPGAQILLKEYPPNLNVNCDVEVLGDHIHRVGKLAEVKVVDRNVEMDGCLRLTQRRFLSSSDPTVTIDLTVAGIDSNNGLTLVESSVINAMKNLTGWNETDITTSLTGIDIIQVVFATRSNEEATALYLSIEDTSDAEFIAQLNYEMSIMNVSGVSFTDVGDPLIVRPPEDNDDSSILKYYLLPCTAAFGAIVFIALTHMSEIEDKLSKKNEKKPKEYEEYDPTVNGPEVDYTVTGEISVGDGERGEKRNGKYYEEGEEWLGMNGLEVTSEKGRALSRDFYTFEPIERKFTPDHHQ